MVLPGQLKEPVCAFVKRLVSTQMARALALALIVAATLVGSESSQQPAAVNNLFTAAGFVVRYADTPEKLEHLRRLPPDKLVTRLRNGRKYYVYADPTVCQCAYVGTAEAYRVYRAGSNADQSSQGSGESSFEQGVDEFNEDYTPSVIGATSFDDYVFGGIRDD
jgi:hypothetical protein